MPSGGKPDGSCLCGSVTFKLLAGSQPYFNVICHCGNCSRSSGSLLGATNGIWAKSAVTLSNASHALRVYEDFATDSGVPLVRQFCGRCGSPLFATTALAPDIVSVFAGALLQPARVGFGPPFKEQYLDCKTDWVSQMQGAMLRSQHPRGCHTYREEDVQRAKREAAAAAAATTTASKDERGNAVGNGTAVPTTSAEILRAKAEQMVETGIPDFV